MGHRTEDTPRAAAVTHHPKGGKPPPRAATSVASGRMPAMAREIIPLGFPARVSYADEDDEERNGTAFGFEWDAAEQTVSAWLVAPRPQLEALTVRVPADRMKRLPGLHT